jgi:hypothetical protein
MGVLLSTTADPPSVAPPVPVPASGVVPVLASGVGPVFASGVVPLAVSSVVPLRASGVSETTPLPPVPAPPAPPEVDPPLPFAPGTAGAPGGPPPTGEAPPGDSPPPHPAAIQAMTRMDRRMKRIESPPAGSGSSLEVASISVDPISSTGRRNCPTNIGPLARSLGRWEGGRLARAAPLALGRPRLDQDRTARGPRPAGRPVGHGPARRLGRRCHGTGAPLRRRALDRDPHRGHPRTSPPWVARAGGRS